MEKEICAKLRREIFAEKCKPTQLLREFQRWKGLMSRPTVKQELSSERETLVAQLREQFMQMREDFVTRTGQKFDAQAAGFERPP